MADSDTPALDLHAFAGRQCVATGAMTYCMCGLVFFEAYAPRWCGREHGDRDRGCGPRRPAVARARGSRGSGRSPMSDTPALPEPERTFIPMRRGADLLGAVLDAEGNPVVSFGCDCATVTDVVLAGASTTPNGTYEVAFTCDGCLTSHWVTFKVGQPDA